MSLEDAAGRSRLEGLLELRAQLARLLDSCESLRDYAALSLRFTDVLEQIEACERANPVVKGTALDEVNARRAAKAAKGQGRAPRSRVGR